MLVLPMSLRPRPSFIKVRRSGQLASTSFGARPLKRVLQRHVQDALAELLLSGEIAEDQQVPISAEDAGLVIAGQLAKPMAVTPQDAVLH